MKTNKNHEHHEHHENDSGSGAGKPDARSARRPDAMRALADARPAALDPLLLAGSRRQREDLERITSRTPDRPAAARSAWLRPRLLPLGAVATVAASAVVVGALVQHGTAGTTGVRAKSSPSAAVSAGADDRLQLLAAAEAAGTSATGGTYWQVTTESQNVDVVGAAGRHYALDSTATEQWSVGVRPGAESLMVSGLAARTAPRAAADAARWRAAGSPRKVSGPARPGSRSAVRFTVGTSRPTVLHTNVGDQIYALGPDNVSYRELQRLPTDTDGLRRELLGRYAREGAAAGERAEWLLRQAADLITMPVRSGTRAAAYRVIANLPGIRVDASATDPLGRAGVAVSLPRKAVTLLGGVAERLVVDPGTGALLSDQDVLVEPSALAREAGLTAGTTVRYAATTRMEWADRQIGVPKDAREE